MTTPTATIPPTSVSLSSPTESIRAGRTWCQLDRIVCACSALLLITGLALFILHAFYVGYSTTPIYRAATAFTSVGLLLVSFCFVSFLFSRMCSNVPGTLSFFTNGTAFTDGPQKPPIPPNEITTRDFFENHGIFGLPESLLQDLDQWRAFRNGNPNIVPPNAGMLLVGPPGCGKTEVAHLIGLLLGGSPFSLASGTLISHFEGDTEKQISSLFTVPKGNFRVITIDEIDGLLQPRGRSNDFSRNNNQTVSHFLSTVEGKLGAAVPRRFILIGTTNLLDNVDSAAQRAGRLGCCYNLTWPNQEALGQILEYHLRGQTLGLSPQEKARWIAHMADYCYQQARGPSPYSGADLVAIIAQAKNHAALAGSNLSIQHFPANMQENWSP